MIDKFVDWLDGYVGKKIETLEKEQPVVVEPKHKKKKKPVTARKLEVGESRDLKKKGRGKKKTHYSPAIKERASKLFADGYKKKSVVYMLEEEFGKSIPLGTINNWLNSFRKQKAIEEQMVIKEIPMSGKTKAEPDDIVYDGSEADRKLEVVKEQAINLVVIKTDDELLDLWKDEKVANKWCPICWAGETTLVATARDNSQVTHRSDLYVDEHMVCANCSAQWVVTYRFVNYEIKN